MLRHASRGEPPHGALRHDERPREGVRGAEDLRRRGFRGERAVLVPGLVSDLLAWYRESDLPPLIKSAVSHCGLEFIHPFADGNGHMGRLWHRLLLGQWRRLVIFVPADELILRRREEYYRALGEADRSGDCTGFLEFMLQVILDSIRELSARCEQDTDQGRLLRAFGNETLSAAELMRRTGLFHMPTFRKIYLNPALEQGAY